MNIDYNKILQKKQENVDKATRYTFNTESYSDFVSTLSDFVEESADVINDNICNLCSNSRAIPFITSYIQTDNLSLKKLSEMKNSLSESTSSLNTIIDKAISYKSSMEWLRIDTLYQLGKDRFKKECVAESGIEDELDIIGYNINTSPNALTAYAKILSRIELEEYDDICDSFPALITRNTQLILGLTITIKGSLINTMTSLPVIIAKRIVDDGTTKQRKAFINVLDKQIADVKNYLTTGKDSRHYDIDSAYLDELIRARNILVRNSYTLIENIAEMQPDIVMYEDGVIDDPVAAFEDEITNMVFDDNDEIPMESLIRLTRIMNEMTIIEEGKVTSAIRKGATKVATKTTKLASKADAASKDIHQTSVALKKTTDPISRAATDLINKIKNMDKEERRNRIIKNEFKFRLFKTLSTIIRAIAVVTVGVSFGTLGGLAVALIGLIASFAIDQHLDMKVRKELARELETELAVVNEKLDDSKGENDKQAKYQLIRIKKKLENDLDRVKFNVKG